MTSSVAPAFSRGGGRIAFFSLEDDERVLGIYDTATGQVAKLQLSRPLAFSDNDSFLWLDNDTLIFSASEPAAEKFEENGFSNLFITDLNGQVRQLTATPAYESILAVDRSNRRILFEAECPFNTWHLLTYDLDTKQVGSLTAALGLSNRAAQAVLSPDNQHLAFTGGNWLWIAPYADPVPFDPGDLKNCSVRE